jgi:hypothetical protein
MDKTNQELWEETLRTAELLKQMEPSTEAMEKAAVGTIPTDKDCLPIQYVADAHVLTHLILSLKDRGVEIN